MPVYLQASDLPGGYGIALLQTLLALAAVCVLAWVVLRWSAKRGLGGAGRRVKVLERIPLDARRALYLVQIGERVLLLGGGDGAAPTLIAELAEDELPELEQSPANFAAVLDKLRRKD